MRQQFVVNFFSKNTPKNVYFVDRQIVPPNDLFNTLFLLSFKGVAKHFINFDSLFPQFWKAKQFLCHQIFYEKGMRRNEQ